VLQDLSALRTRFDFVKRNATTAVENIWRVDQINTSFRPHNDWIVAKTSASAVQIRYMFSGLVARLSHSASMRLRLMRAA
jgi:hypothetical protein